ncbi:MAG: ABC transporter substrate-binding protein [Deltaproteobacteria bacterium]|nr:ABC transporter substrate-binding protein [Deltaproteobacteria bacterium]
MERRSWWKSLVPVSLILSLSFAGPAAAEANKAAPKTAPAPKAAKPAVAVPKAAPKPGGRLKIAVALDADQLGDPVARPFSSMGRRFSGAGIETLLRYDAQGRLVPWLAKEWKVAKDLAWVTLTLRSGVKFHDGTDFNAEAVRWNLERYRTSTNPELKAVSSVEVVNDSTVKLNLSEWSSTLVDTLADYPGMMISPTAFQKAGSDGIKTNPVGTGPFKFASWQRDVGAKYEKFEGYWQKGKPYLDGIEWVVIKDPMSRIAAFRAGEVNATLIVEPKEVNELEKEGKYTFSTGGLSAMAICLVGDSGHANSPFADVRVRRAVSHAIDAKSLVDALTRGFGRVSNQYALVGSWGQNPNVKGYPYDPAKAKKLLAEAGYPNGFKAKLVAPSWGLFTYPVPVFQEALRKVGIEVEIETVDQIRHKTILHNGWQNALMMQPGSLVSPDVTNNLVVYASCRSYLKGTMACPDDYNAALGQALAAKDFETKKKWTWEAQKLLVDKYALFNFAYNVPRMNAFHQEVRDTGFGATTDTQWTPEDAWIGR